MKEKNSANGKESFILKFLKVLDRLLKGFLETGFK